MFHARKGGLAAAAATALVGLALGSLALPTSGHAPVTVVSMLADEYFYMPDSLEVEAGAAISLTLDNVGRFPHNIVFELDDDRTITSETIVGGEQTSVGFDAPMTPGAYVYYCSIGSHRDLGMEGSLTVGDIEEGPAVLVDGLANPRGLAVDGNTLMVSEGGTADVTPGQFGPGHGDGRVLAVDIADPSQRQVVVAGLTNSHDPGGGVVGANHGIWRGASLASDTVLVALSGGDGHPDPKAQLLAGVAGEAFEVLADLWALEEAENPDGGDIGSNPWRILTDGDTALVTDAGANSVVAVDLDTGEARVFAVFEPVGERPDGAPISAVPTGIVETADGAIYVALLGSFDEGAGQIRRLTDLDGDGTALGDGENVLAAGGLTTPTDLAVGPDGNVYVLTFGGFAAQGTLGRLEADGTVTVLVTGLPAASALVFAANGDALVAAGPGNAGFATDRVLRIDWQDLSPEPVVTPTSQPEVTPTVPPSGGKVYLPRGQKP